jgi:CDP-diacylglycerol--glycerol-3-phosphate 3-phosphatidyltransferase
MDYTLPNLLTLARILLIPLFVLVYYLPFDWANETALTIFLLAAVTDWLDGYLARRMGQYSRFGAFLDPVADKLMVTTALVLLSADPRVQSSVVHRSVFAIVAAIIIGREIVISALREWMAELGKRATVAVSRAGKIKTVMQMLALSLLIYQAPKGYGFIFTTGEILLFIAAGLTLWSMAFYLLEAWRTLSHEADLTPEKAPVEPAARPAGPVGLTGEDAKLKLAPSTRE